jgi:hypothetical protein
MSQKILLDKINIPELKLRSIPSKRGLCFSRKSLKTLNRRRVKIEDCVVVVERSWNEMVLLIKNQENQDI